MINRIFAIVGGAEKAGTTSLYSYLSAHPEVCASSHKETDYFREADSDLEGYMHYFKHCDNSAKILLESSPGYLAEAESVAPRIGKFLPECKMIFLLREPIERLKSSFRFYKSRLHIPDAMTFDDFADRCLRFELEGQTPAQLGVEEWYLKSLARGCYDKQLEPFRLHLKNNNLLVLSFDQLRDDVGGTVKQVADFLGIDPYFYDTYNFGRENVTFFVKDKLLHKIAIWVNDNFETFWRRNPNIKKRLLNMYKQVNGRNVDKEVASDQTVQRLHDYYLPSVNKLLEITPCNMEWAQEYAK